jgi:signal transduction histidine kinase
MHIQHSDFHDQLVRGLTHKMNNILSLFHGYLALLLDGKQLDPALADGLARIKEGATAASELMDRTKDLARPSSVIWREINVPEFLQRLRPSLESHLERGQKLEIECPDELPRIWADASRLCTAVCEIVRNACEASPRGSAVRIEAHAVANGASAPPASGAAPIPWVAITISDNGPGIEPAIEEKIFAPFFSTKRKKNATGLGLTVSGGLVQQLGGVIRFNSKPGCTSFQILLPSRSERV